MTAPRKLKRVVSLNYPASRLPPKLRGDFDPTLRVTVTVSEIGPEDSEWELDIKDFSDLPHAGEDDNVTFSDKPSEDRS
ncbi:hypothetical protein [Antarcticirhabdus aurantiaca]|uniref:Uncharacterized protein n=1 Tax=Antarcticirhabdus aurantiaca TaxID=2606717 RepID=A0ACD4NTK2_9HYPH|nr:hypothetical protein [Antarcticirhabdus aurantiaca]WAJ30142.1 hypothetical protein OXU80_08020 [Jeongeuplla avenae]